MTPPVQADASDAPIVFTGVGASGSSLSPDDVLVEIQPDPGFLASLPAGASVHNSVVPTSQITVDGDRFSVRLDPKAIPPRDITPQGLVTLFVRVSNASDTSFSEDMFSVRAVVTADGSFAWAGAGAPTVSSRTRSVPADASRAVRVARAGGFAPTDEYASRLAPVTLRTGEPVHPGSLERLRDHDVAQLATANRAGGASSAAGIERPAYDRSSCHPGGVDGGAGDVYGRKVRSSATIGTAYPVAKDTAWMMFDEGTTDSTDFRASFGTAPSGAVIGTFTAGKEKALDRSVGFDWDPMAYARSFRVQLKYQLLKHYYDRCPPSDPYSEVWQPMAYTGGFGENREGVNRPNWTKCVKIRSVGVWRKQATDSRAYTYNAGVKFAQVVGFDLSVTRKENTQASLRYRIGRTKRRMCGSDDTPGTATKVMEKVAR